MQHKDEDIKKVNIQVSKECLKKLKILSIQKDVTLANYVRELLERSVGRKNIQEITFTE